MYMYIAFSQQVIHTNHWLFGIWFEGLGLCKSDFPLLVVVVGNAPRSVYIHTHNSKVNVKLLYIQSPRKIAHLVCKD